MKKLMVLCLLVLQGFMFQTFAENYLVKTTNLCAENDRIKLKKDFTYEVWINDILNYSGTWEFENNDCSAIIMTYEIEDEVGNNTVQMYLRVIEQDRGLGDMQGDFYKSIYKVEFQDQEYSTENCY